MNELDKTFSETGQNAGWKAPLLCGGFAFLWGGGSSNASNFSVLQEPNLGAQIDKPPDMFNLLDGGGRGRPREIKGLKVYGKQENKGTKAGAICKNYTTFRNILRSKKCKEARERERERERRANKNRRGNRD